MSFLCSSTYFLTAPAIFHIDIAQITGLNWQTVRKILSDNEKFLKRNDIASLNELHRYITKWECDEYNIDTDEDWD